MKKILASLIAVSMIASPAIARDRHEHRNQHGESHGERRGGGCGWLCGAIIGGLVVGVIDSANDREQERRDNDYRNYDNRYYPPNVRYDTRYCVREQVVEWRYGERYIYWQTTCN